LHKVKDQGMRHGVSQARTFTFSDSMSLVGRVLLTAWVMGLGYFLYTFVRNDSIVGLALMGLIGLCGIGIGARLFTRPRLEIIIAPAGDVTYEDSGLRERARRYAVLDLSVLDILEGKNGNGDPYFRCLMRLPDGRTLTVSEARSRQSAEKARNRLLSALGFDSAAPPQSVDIIEY
jgi:hypothetical protein